MKINESDPGSLATKPRHAASAADQFFAASLAGIMRDYPGFEPEPDDPAIEEGATRLRPELSRGWPGSPDSRGRAATESRRRVILPSDDRETVWPEQHFAAEPPCRERSERPRSLSRRGADLQQAATIYLRSQRGDVAPDASSLAGVLPDSDQLFRELHAASPGQAQRVAAGLTSMPAPGDDFLGFRIVDELGRGAFGRVFLAHQGNLADRVVALKVSAELAEESQTLAQLQHTNIMPIFSAHQAHPFHAVCMPYFGRTTLADLLDDVEDQKSLPESGKAFVKTVGLRRSSGRPGSSRGTRVGPGLPARREDSVGVFGPAESASKGTPAADLPADLLSETMRTIGNFSYVDAVLWMGSRIADGLAHAHGQGILHRDLKPANILITDDGQPMILDFNLSEDLKNEVGASAASVGGTLRYMSPEHLERFLGGEVEVDGRSDLFALGVILFELLTGRPPFEVRPGHSIATLRKMIADRATSPTIRGHNPAITPAVESIVRHCLEADPDRRYGSAAELREDLERHLNHLPLRYAPEPSLGERARKWVKRHPWLKSTSTVAIVATLVLAGLGSALMARGHRLARLEAANDLARFRNETSSVRFLLNHRADDQLQRSRGQALAIRALSRYGVLDDPAWFRRPMVASLMPEKRDQLREEVSEILLMLTQAEAVDATERVEGQERREKARSAERHNQLAMAAFPNGREPQAFWVQQATLLGLLGQEAEGARLAAEAEKLPLRTPRDHYLAAVGLASRGEYAKALPLAEEATQLDPRHFWSYFILGVCYDRLDRSVEAMACFTTCTALQPEFAEAWLYRGLAHLKRSNLDKARADFDRASRLRPDWYEPYLSRSLAYRELGDHRKAENDLTHALDLGAPETRIYFLRAAERRANGDARGAELDQAEGLKRQPADVASWISRGIARMSKEPEAALLDFQAALKLDPKSLDAFQYSAYLLSMLPGRDQETIRMLDDAVKQCPNSSVFRSGRGVQLAVQGRRDEAHVDARESLWRDTSPQNLYQIAGIYATTSKTHPEDRLEAFRLLSSALRGGYGFELIDGDRELDAIRHDPDFVAMVDSARRLCKERLPRPGGR